MSIVDDDTMLRDSELRAMREITRAELTEPDEGADDPAETLLQQEHGSARLNHYVLLSKLGQGGMGVVYAAYDQKLDRKVALKLLRSDGDRKARKRLVREAQSMARLSHPNVVQIYEIGEAEELIFIVMEFVAGQTLKQWLAATPRSQQDILAVFLAAGRGLAAAHAEGLVHRDFKPDNVMLRDDGRVLVMDFGLAHVDSVELVERGQLGTEPMTEPSGLTATGVLLGTPAYMSPEQFEGSETDARTDQFSFCVALWEALHGQRPFAGSSLMDLSVAVCSGSYSVPEHSDVPSWLRRVLERGLHVEPEQRWPSLDALLDALRRDPTRRRRGVIVTVAALGVGLTVLAGLAVVGQRTEAKAVRACEAEGAALSWSPEREATLAARFEATGLGYASSAWEHTRSQLDSYAQAWAAARTQTCIETRVEHTRDEASLAIITACLDERRATFEGLLDAWAEIDETALARATSAVASLPPVSTCTTQLWLARRLQPPAELHDQVTQLRGQIEQARAREFTGQYDEGLARNQDILREAEALAWRPLVAEALVAVGQVQHKRGDYEDARGTLEQGFLAAVGAGHDMLALNAASQLASVVGHELAEPERGLFWGRLGLELIARLGLADSAREGQLLSNIGVVHTRAGDFDEALATHERALAIIRTTLGPQHIRIAIALNNTGGVHWERGDHEAALASFREGLAIRRIVLGDSHPETATSVNNIGAVYWAQGDYQGALAAFEEVVAIRERALGPRHPDVAAALTNIAAVRATLGEFERSLDAARRALTIQEATIGPEHPDIAGTLTNIANILRGQGSHAEALETHQRALEIWEHALGPEHPKVAMALNNIGVTLSQRGELDEALAAHRRALEIREAAFGPDHPEVAMSLDNIGGILGDIDQPEQALVQLRRAVEIRETALGPDHPSVADSLDDLGSLLSRLGQSREALEIHQRALAIREPPLGPDHLDVSYSLLGIGIALGELGQYSEARVALDRALAIREQAEATPSEMAEAHFELAQVLWDEGEQARARTLAKTAGEELREASGASVSLERLRQELGAWLDAHP